MIRKGLILGLTRQNLFGQAWVFGALLPVNKLIGVPRRPATRRIHKLQHFHPGHFISVWVHCGYLVHEIDSWMWGEYGRQYAPNAVEDDSPPDEHYEREIP